MRILPANSSQGRHRIGKRLLNKDFPRLHTPYFLFKVLFKKTFGKRSCKEFSGTDIDVSETDKKIGYGFAPELFRRAVDCSKIIVPALL